MSEIPGRRITYLLRSKKNKKKNKKKKKTPVGPQNFMIKWLLQIEYKTKHVSVYFARQLLYQVVITN